MNILVLGSGGREHTFCWKLSQSKLCKNLYVAPGNGGTANFAKNINLKISDFEEIKKVVINYSINLVVVGPEEPLVMGIHDFFLDDKDLSGVGIIGPQKHGSMLEGSKAFAKDFMKRHQIPTAKYAEFTAENILEAELFLENSKPPYVLKADGLAAGKGVLIIEDLSEAKEELRKMLIEGKFGKASKKVVIEEFLEGIELSCFVLTDGKNFITLPMAKDYKRIGEGDTGLNTGGMGALSPVPFVDSIFENKILDKIIKPTIEGMRLDNIPYKGFIFIGLIKVGDEPKVIEYNVRMGDPETEVVIPRINNDLVTIFKALNEGNLDKIELDINSKSAATIMAVSKGYPENYEKDKIITGIQKDPLVFHAGTRLKSGKLKTSGGRVLSVTSLDIDYRKAINKSYKKLRKIYFDGIHYRKDIGFDL